MLTPRPYVTAHDGHEAFSPRAFLEQSIEIIERQEPAVQAFVTLDLASARRQADESDARWKAGRQRSAIDGMPVGVKDIIFTRDMPTEMGSPLFKGWQPDDDAASVSALREAGAVIVGKTVTTEFAATVPGPTRNPHDHSRTPGGSSSGSAAAVGCGMLSGALGTQVVGSILRPASYCGCVGYKPSLGAINRGGSLDFLSQSVTGTIAASVSDAWALAKEIAGRVGGDPGSPGLIFSDAPLRAAKPKSILLLNPGANAVAEPSGAEILEVVRRLLEREGIAVTLGSATAELRTLEETLTTAITVTQEINARESVWPLNAYSERDVTKLSPLMIGRLAQGRAIGGGLYREKLAQRQEARELFVRLARPFDACLALSAAGPAPLGLESTGSPLFAVASSYLGVPAVNLPAGRANGLPIGVQLIGFLNEDEALMAHAAWLEAKL